MWDRDDVWSIRESVWGGGYLLRGGMNESIKDEWDGGVMKGLMINGGVWGD